MKALPIQKETICVLIYSSHFLSGNLKVSLFKATILINLCVVRQVIPSTFFTPTKHNHSFIYPEDKSSMTLG